MSIILVPLLEVLYLALTLYSYALLGYVILCLLLNFQVINPTHQLVRMVMAFLYKLVEPTLGKIRSVIPSVGPFDLSPIVLLLAIYFLQGVIHRLLSSMIAGG